MTLGRSPVSPISAGCPCAGLSAPAKDAYRCPAGERLPYRYTNEEDGKMLRRYWTTACQNCSLKSQCTTGPERRITRWEHEHLLPHRTSAISSDISTGPDVFQS